jgi:hypothetical protein
MAEFPAVRRLHTTTIYGRQTSNNTGTTTISTRT